MIHRLTAGTSVRAARIAVTLALALAIVPGTALAARPWSVTVPIQEGNGFCGADMERLPVIGHVTLARRGPTLTLTFALDGALASSSYQASLWDGQTCEMVADLGGIATDGNGDATGTFALRLREDVPYFAAIHGTNGWNDTPIAIR